MRRLIAATLTSMLLLAGCGGGDSEAPGPAAGGSTPGTRASSSAAATSSAGTATEASSCPTENTRAFAKTRFVADVGGALFLFHRYLYRPYLDGSFEAGAQGRTAALVKAGLAAAGIAKLLANARENAAANPTLCKAVTKPLDDIITSTRGLATGLPAGQVDDRALKDIESQFGRVQNRAEDAGVRVEEKETSLRP